MILNYSTLIGGIALLICGAWRLCRQNPRHRLQRRGQIACVGGGGAAVLGFTFCLTPQSWGDTLLLCWCGVTIVILLLNESVSSR
ncbi:MAG: hypothetical protein IJB26_03680 [Clostridia bacterium]|nr:hypothetical protein [Clostridia bacterium]